MKMHDLWSDHKPGGREIGIDDEQIHGHRGVQVQESGRSRGLGNEGVKIKGCSIGGPTITIWGKR